MDGNNIEGKKLVNYPKNENANGCINTEYSLFRKYREISLFLIPLVYICQLTNEWNDFPVKLFST